MNLQWATSGMVVFATTMLLGFSHIKNIRFKWGSISLVLVAAAVFLISLFLGEGKFVSEWFFGCALIAGLMAAVALRQNLSSDSSEDRKYSVTISSLFLILFLSWAWSAANILDLFLAWSGIIISNEFLAIHSGKSQAGQIEISQSMWGWNLVALAFLVLGFSIPEHGIYSSSAALLVLVGIFPMLWAQVNRSAHGEFSTHALRLLALGFLAPLAARVLIPALVLNDFWKWIMLALSCSASIYMVAATFSSDIRIWMGRTWLGWAQWGAALWFLQDPNLQIVWFAGAITFGLVYVLWEDLNWLGRFFGIMILSGLPVSPFFFSLKAAVPLIAGIGELGAAGLIFLGVSWSASIWGSLMWGRRTLLNDRLPSLNRQVTQRIISTCLFILGVLTLFLAEWKLPIFIKS